jgi:hypothetical protein
MNLQSAFVFVALIFFLQCKTAAPENQTKTISELNNTANFEVIGDTLRFLVETGIKKNRLDPEVFGVTPENFANKELEKNLYEVKNPLIKSMEYIGEFVEAIATVLIDREMPVERFDNKKFYWVDANSDMHVASFNFKRERSEANKIKVTLAGIWLYPNGKELVLDTESQSGGMIGNIYALLVIHDKDTSGKTISFEKPEKDTIH